MKIWSCQKISVSLHRIKKETPPTLETSNSYTVMQLKHLRHLSFILAADSNSLASVILLRAAYRAPRIIYPPCRRISVSSRYSAASRRESAASDYLSFKPPENCEAAEEDPPRFSS